MSSPTLLLAFGLGSGMSPKGPGTAGSVVALLFYPLLAQLPLPLYMLVVAITIVVGAWVCGRAAGQLGVHDHGGIVLDEIAGLWLALGTFPATLPWMLGGFVLFRLFDIWKPWPICVLDRNLAGGWGIMLDDVVAGALTWLVLALVQFGL
jgi:phosphatidylglycerophosphatase A